MADETNNTTGKRSPVWGRTSIFTTVEEANKEHAEREKLLKGIAKKSLYAVYQVPVPNGKECYYAVELNPLNAISAVAAHLGWVAQKLTGNRAAVVVTPATIAAQASANNWGKEDIEEAIKLLQAAKKGK